MKTGFTKSFSKIVLVFSTLALLFSASGIRARAFADNAHLLNRNEDSSKSPLVNGTIPYTQQGAKLTGLGTVREAGLGYSIAVSGDGNTAISGGFADNDGVGAAWIFTRNSSGWVQQGNKLMGTGAIGRAHQGISVAISQDGNTAIIGGYTDNSGIGAAWIFTFNKGVWMQQGEKLIASDFKGFSGQGISVSLSSDGNTALVGGLHDQLNKGAAWVYSRINGIWVQQGLKLTGLGGTENDLQGCSVSLSGDGETALIGGFGSQSATGAVWVFTHSSGTWSQQGPKLVGTGGLSAGQGLAVSLSQDGNTALIGGFADNNHRGAAWIFIRKSTTWFQQGAKLVGTGARGAASQGRSVAISANGSTVLIGGYYDSLGVGAAWIFRHHRSGWVQEGSKISGHGVEGSQQGRSVALNTDGSTLMTGGSGDSSGVGAVWVFTGPGALADTIPVIKVVTVTPVKVIDTVHATVSRVYSADLVSLATVNIESELLFNADSLTYSVIVPGTIDSYTLLPLAKDSNARVSLNGVFLSRGHSGTMFLVNGANTMSIKVVAADGTTQKVYFLTIHRMAAPAPSVVQVLSVANNILTPNGDGINDTWAVSHILDYPRNHVAVYNAAGGLVYAKAGYANDWGGTYRGRLLPEGSYFYEVNLGNGTVYRGFISIMNRLLISSI